MKISAKNSKLGNIPNISLVPIKDCGNCKHCKADCYAVKAYKQYSNVRDAWQSNSRLANSNLEVLEGRFHNWYASKRTPPPFFRIHVAGDFVSQDYLDMWIRLATQYSATKFLVFTKMHHLDFSCVTDNFVIIFSQWPGMDKGNDSGINAWLSHDPRVPETAFLCPGGADKNSTTCRECLFCFSQPTTDVIFGIH